MRICPKCKNEEIKDKANYCFICGEKLNTFLKEPVDIYSMIDFAKKKDAFDTQFHNVVTMEKFVVTDAYKGLFKTMEKNENISLEEMENRFENENLFLPD